jgi:hypothetical protein
MNLLSKETLIGAASLGAGAVAAKIVHAKVIPNIPVTALQGEVAKNLITLAAGIFTPIVVKGSIGTGLGAGMIAASVAGLIEPTLRGAKLINGTDTFMGDVFLGNDTMESGTLMGASENIFDAPSNDFTEGGAGEMDY